MDGPVRRARARRIAVFAGATATLVTATALPAFAHASFPSSSAFGFAPNTQGGTGAVGAAPPYPAGTTQTVYLRAPFEQTEPHNGADDTTVDVRAIVPAGWTNPMCGPAKKQINNASTNNTNQPADNVAGWSCELTEQGGRQVVHWSGPQVTPPATAADSAQFFVFSVTTPSPAAQTTYNGTLGTEGFIVDQRYASGETMHWIPNAEFPGTPPEGSTISVAGGLARTVAAADLLGYTGVQPSRILDTREDLGLAGTFGNGQTRNLTVTGVGGVPVGAKAVVLNVTVTGGDHTSDLRLWPAGQPQPTVSNLNWTAGQTIPNLVMVKVGDAGQVSIRNNEGNVQVIADVVGYYTGGGDVFTGVQPDRILDTREDLGLADAFGEAQTRNLTVTGVGGVPDTATSVVLNVTATGGDHASDLRLWPAGQTQPEVSNLNWVAGETFPNLVVVKVGDLDQVSIRNNEGNVDVIADVVGYFQPTTGDKYAALQPSRILDTRDDLGLAGPFGDAQTRNLTVTGVGGVPDTATAVVLNVTVTGGDHASDLRLWPAGQTQPEVSNLNWVAGETFPNLVVVKVGDLDQVSIRNNEGNVEVIADVVGYFVPPPA